MHKPHRATAFIDTKALKHNYAQVRYLVGADCLIYASVKANAYGHGVHQVATILVSAGVNGLLVATPEEALEVVGLALGVPVILLGAPFIQDIPTIIESGAECCISDIDFAKALSDYCCATNTTCSVHLKIDTGMGRIGFRPERSLEYALAINSMPGINIVGLMTHFPSSDETDNSFTSKQIADFSALAAEIEKAVGKRIIKHAANSGAILWADKSLFDAVRPGIMLYGCYPGPEAAKSVELQPVMTLSASVCQIKLLRTGETVSYGRTWKASRDTIVATVAIGYGDGLPRALSNTGQALVRNRKAPIIGRVCMDMTMLDVTDIPGVRVGDQAVFWGKQNNTTLNVEEVAQTAGTIPYELTTQITSRVRRVYL